MMPPVRLSDGVTSARPMWEIRLELAMKYSPTMSPCHHVPQS